MLYTGRGTYQCFFVPVPYFDREKAALILADAEVVGVGKAAESWGINRRSIAKYRQRLKSDPDLSQLFSSKKQERARMWAKEIEAALEVCVNGLVQHVPHLPLGDPQSIHVLAGAIKILGEIKLNAEVLHGSPTETDQN